MGIRSFAGRSVLILPALFATGLLSTLVVHAFNPQPDPPKVFGLLGITLAETARLNVVVPAGAPSTAAPAAGCRVALSFLSADGQVLRQQSITVLQGHSASLEMPGVQAFLPPGPIRSLRADIRPVVEATSTQTSGAPCQVVTTFELFDSATGKTSIFADPPPVGDRPASTGN